MENVVQATVNGLNAEFEKKVVEGLKLKGFEFSSKRELHDFIKTRCACLEYVMHKTKEYTVDGETFLTVGTEMHIAQAFTADGVTFTAHINYQYPTK